MKSEIRQPIVCVLGHVDSGKTTLLDKIRGSAVASREVGSMTQHIGASLFPIETLKEICGPLAEGFIDKIEIDGLLVIDTPGHSIFMNLRRRGGSVADIAILVVDVLRGFEPQTHESVSILKNRKTPFIVAANKIDTIPGWIKHPDTTFLQSFRNQRKPVQRRLDELIYILMGSLSRLGFKSDRFDRVTDFTETLAIAPISAATGEGIPELLAVLIGLTQEYLEKRLTLSEGAAKGTILEVKEEAGLGTTIDAIIYDGILNKGDTIVLGARGPAIVTNVRALLLPKPLDEMRDPRDKFSPVESVSAAAGVKIASAYIDDAIPGGPLYAVEEGGSSEDLVKRVSREVNRLRVITDKIGVVLKTDALGSLEALMTELENHGIPVRHADVGNVSRREVVEASLVKRTSRIHGVILAFNVKVLQDAEEEARVQRIPVFQNNVIHRLIQDYSSWVDAERAAMIKERVESLIHPGKISIISGLVFRKSDPAIFGVKVVSGKIKPTYPLITANGDSVGEILQIQDRGEALQEAEMGQEVAISVRGGVVGRDFNEEDTLYVAVPEDHVRKFLSEYAGLLSTDDIETLKELIMVMRKRHVLWGI